MNTVTTLALNLAFNNRGIYGVTIVDTMENNMVKALFYIYIYILFGDRCPPYYIFISIMLDNTIILIREGGTVFDFRRLQHWDVARVAASLVVEYSPVTFVLISAVSLRVFTAEYIFSCVI